MNLLDRTRVWIAEKISPPGIGNPTGITGSVGQVGPTDIWNTQRVPTKHNLVEEYKGIAYSCANLNSRAVASTKRRLFVITKGGDRKPLSDTRRLEPEELKWIFQNHKSLKSVHGNVEVEEVLEHKVLQLLREANECHDGYTLSEMTQLYLETVGSSFWVIERNSIGIPKKIFILASQFVEIFKQEDGSISHYEYGQLRKKFEVDEIIQFTFTNLRDPYGEGWSPLRAAYEAIHIVNQHNAFTQNQLENQARPDTIASPKDKDSYVGEPEANRLEKRLNQKFRQGGTGRVIVWGGEALDFKPLTFSSRDMERQKEYSRAKEEIANAFDVPMSLLTSQNIIRANAEAGNFQHAKLAVWPRVRKQDERLNQSLLPMYPDGRRMFFLSDNPVPEDQEQARKERETNIKIGLSSANEERRKVGLSSEPWGEEPLVSNTLVPVSFQIQSPPSPQSQSPKTKIFVPEEGENILNPQPETRELEAAFRKVFRAQSKAFERSMRRLEKQTFSNEQMLAFLANWVNPITLEEWVEITAIASRSIIESASRKGGDRAAKRISEQANIEFAFNVQNPRVQDAIDRNVFRLAESTVEVTAGNLREAVSLINQQLRDGIIAGPNTIDDLTKRINAAVFGNAEKVRARRIARTESNRAVHAGQRLSAEQSGVVSGYKWLLSADPCPICIAIEAQNPEISLNGTFKTENTEFGDIPHPPAHPNCRCSLIELF